MEVVLWHWRAIQEVFQGQDVLSIFFYVIILLHSKWVLFASALWSPDPKDFKIQEQFPAIFKLTKQTWSNKYLLIAKTLQFSVPEAIWAMPYKT